MIRKFKITYALYNLFHYGLLKHNVSRFKKFGINKFYFSPISKKDFAKANKNVSLRTDEFVAVDQSSYFLKADNDTQESIQSFFDNGYCILQDYLSSEQVDGVNREIESLLANKKVEVMHSGKIMFAFHQSDVLKSVGKNPEIMELLQSLMQEKMALFQSINFLMGSEQLTHSDSIHMTTYPEGGLLGLWIALEDIHLENGPLHYYPGSHKLPYYDNSDYGNEGNMFMLGNKGYYAYERMIAEKMTEYKMEKKVFTCKKGDALIWHANLFHGGEPHLNKQFSRKSMVLHYFATERICYHEFTQRPALMHEL